MTPKRARKLVRETRKQVEFVEAILLKLGDNNLHLPLNQRFAKALASPVDLADPSAGKLRSKLLREVGKLTELLRDFLE